MTDGQRPMVGKIVEKFKEELDPAVRDQITGAQYSALAIMIEEAIAEEVGSAASMVEEVGKKLRARVGGGELGM